LHRKYHLSDVEVPAVPAARGLFEMALLYGSIVKARLTQG
jgi:hypothetical protein